ncbi:MAG: hypothetical protein ACLTQI_00860 [Slackia sp.]
MTETKAAAGEQTPIIFLDDIHVVFKTSTEFHPASEQGACCRRTYAEAHAGRDHRYRRRVQVQ